MMMKTMLLRFAASVLAAIVLTLGIASTASAAECRRTGSVCSQPGGTRVINGVSVTRPCWAYQDTYECVQPNYIDYCAGIRSTWGCSQTNSVCSERAFNGECLVYTNTFRCSDKPANPGAQVVLLDTTYTIIQDSIDRTQCASLDANASCKKAASVCVEPGGYRNIDGMQVYKDCWRWRDDYTCVANDYANFCTPLRQSGCTEVQQRCTAHAWNGQCMSYERTYSCDAKMAQPLPTNIVYLDSSYTIIRDNPNMAQCDPLRNNANCTLASHTCIQPGGTRNINGLDVYKDCWEWEDKYVCASDVLRSDCNDLSRNPHCTEVGTTCVDQLPGGQCGLRERVFSCKVKDGETVEDVVCDAGVCVDGNCFAPKTEDDKDFGVSVALMEGARQAGVYFDPDTYTIFKGVSSQCEIKLGGVVNCCKAKGGGVNQSNAYMFGALNKIGGEFVRYMGSTYVYDALFSSDLVSTAVINALYGTGSGTSYSFFGGGRLSFYGITYAPSAAGGLPFAFDPYSFAFAIAMQIITEFLSCEQPEQLLALRKGQRLCTHVGSYCSSKFLGACLAKKESYCCYNSRLARIINEQGRPQLGKTYGDPKNPDCSGFTGPELEQLDFANMDLSEFIDEIMPKDIDINTITDRATDKLPSDYSGGAYFPTEIEIPDPNVQNVTPRP